jgi:hypothetical protein
LQVLPAEARDLQVGHLTSGGAAGYRKVFEAAFETWNKLGLDHAVR